MSLVGRGTFADADEARQGVAVASPEPAVGTPRHRHYRHRKRKKFWKRPSWWATIGKAMLMTLLGIAVLFGMWLVWSGMSSSPTH